MNIKSRTFQFLCWGLELYTVTPSLKAQKITCLKCICWREAPTLNLMTLPANASWPVYFPMQSLNTLLSLEMQRTLPRILCLWGENCCCVQLAYLLRFVITLLIKSVQRERHIQFKTITPCSNTIIMVAWQLLKYRKFFLTVDVFTRAASEQDHCSVLCLNMFFCTENHNYICITTIINVESWLKFLFSKSLFFLGFQEFWDLLWAWGLWF